MRILILNWRCPRNPKAGGAEIVTYEIARRLVVAGHRVEWFASSFPGAQAAEEMDGIQIVRAGRQWTVHWRAFNRYRAIIRQQFDVVIDEVNTIPFFTPLWAGIPHFMFIHQLAREVWWYESPFPLSALGYLAEPLYLKCYRRAPVLTVSASTESDLRGLGLSGPITIVPEGLQPVTNEDHSKPLKPTFLYVGRMAPSKGLADILLAFARFVQTVGYGELWLGGVGRPAYLKRLSKLAKRLGIEREVHFLGYLSTAEKHRLMMQAHALLMASVREGWGLVVTEASACGTPAVVYDVGGLRDAVQNGRTGLVVDPSPVALASGMLRLWRDPDLYKRLSTEGQLWSRSFSFDLTAIVVEKALVSTQKEAETSVLAAH